MINEARIYVDFNERVTENIFLLSADDTKVDSQGNIVMFFENMPILIWSDDGDEEGNWPAELIPPMSSITTERNMVSLRHG